MQLQPQLVSLLLLLLPAVVDASPGWSGPRLAVKHGNTSKFLLTLAITLSYWQYPRVLFCKLSHTSECVTHNLLAGSQHYMTYV